MRTSRFIKGVIAGALMLASSLSGAGAASARAGQGPALWKVADEDTTIYLFGTIHTLPTETQWRTAPIADAIAKSESLVLELLVDDPQATAQVVASLGITPGQPPLAERVPAAKRDSLRKLAASSGLPVPFLDQLESWAAAITLAGISFIQAGFSPESGVETQLTQLYRQAEKPIEGLETAEEQLGFLDTLPEDAQRKLLASTVEDPQAVKKQLQAMLAAWLNGDVKAIATTFDQETGDSPELRKALIITRNQAWSEWVATRMAEPGTVFLAVGAGHLAGSDSLQKMLEARGIKAERVN